jgi:ribulose-bisphosphate carboxylase large chain
MEERAGAKATMQAIEAWKEGQVLDEAGSHVPELAQVLEKWGFYTQ